MTHGSAREARIHLVSEGVVASYIHELSTPGRHPAGPVLGRRLQPRRSRRPEPRHEVQVRTDQRRDRARPCPGPLEAPAPATSGKHPDPVRAV